MCANKKNMKASAPKLDRGCPDTTSSERDTKTNTIVEIDHICQRKHQVFVQRKLEKLDLVGLNMRNVPRKASQTSNRNHVR